MAGQTPVAYSQSTPMVQFLARITGAIATDIETYPKAACLLTSGPLLTRGVTSDVKVHVAPFQYLDASLNVQSCAGGDVILPSGTIPKDKFGIFLVKLTLSTGALSVTAGTANFTSGYDSLVLAQAAVPAVGGGNIAIATFVVQTKTGATFVDRTDGLTGGTSGNVAKATSYFGIAVTPNTIIITFPAAEESKRKVDFIRKELDRLYGARYQSIQIRFAGGYIYVEGDGGGQ